MALPANRGQQIFFDLFSLAGPQNIARPRHHHLQAVRSAAEFPFHQSDAEIIQATPTQLGGHVGRIQPHLDRFGLNRLHQRRGDFIEALYFIFVGVELVFYKRAHRVHNHFLFCCEFEMHRVVSVVLEGKHSRRFAANSHGFPQTLRCGEDGMRLGNRLQTILQIAWHVR